MRNFQYKLYLFLLIVCSFSPIYGQKSVWDIGALETLIANHKAQHSAFSKIKTNESQIAELQKEISLKIAQIQKIETKLYNSLKSVNVILKTGKDLVYIGDIVKDIGKYQSKMLQMAGNDPKLLIVAAQTEKQLISRTTNLLYYIYQVAIIGTDFNLMNNKQRLDLIKYVIDELRIMRGLSFGVCRIMRAAQRNGVLKTLFPGVFRYPNSRDRLVKQILDEYNPKPIRR